MSQCKFGAMVTCELNNKVTSPYIYVYIRKRVLVKQSGGMADDRQPSRFQRYRARQRAADEERRRELASLREEVKRLKDFEDYQK